MDFKPLESGNAVLQTVQCSEGGRAFKLLQERQRCLQGVEAAKAEIVNETKKGRICRIDEKYTGSKMEALEVEFREQTVGLVSAEEFREKRQRLMEKMARHGDQGVSKVVTSQETRCVKSQVQKSKLSFGDALEESCSDADHEEPCLLHKKPVVKGICKDQTVDTSFLSDAEREKRLYEEREKIIQEYNEQQERARQEPLEITYSYWNGLGHRRIIKVKKGMTIGQFLSLCRDALQNEFPKLRSLSTDNLMYIKEDLILPHQITFYELIKNKARGKSGPLFNFDVHDDVRMYSDTRIEKDESHAGKIVDRKWYERNKHIFPASRWELYNPAKTYEKYTIHGNEDYSKKIAP